MVLDGKEYLNKNNYGKIVIRNDELCRGYGWKVKANCGCKYKSVGNKDNFTDTLEKYDEVFNIEKIVNYFLENNTICKIDEGSVRGYPGSFIKVTSIGNRLLALKLPNNNFGKKIMQSILDKYIIDMFNYCFNNNINQIWSSFSDTYYEDDSLCLYYTHKVNTSFQDEEDKFLKRFILEKFDYENRAYIDYIEGKTEELGYFSFGLYLICGNTKIQIDNQIRDRIKPIINEYNMNLTKEKSKQLVLKGWDKL